MNNEKPTTEEWNDIMNAIQTNIGVAVEIPEQFGEHMIDHFTNCLPPIYWDSRSVLCSEPYSHNSDGEPTYIGFYKKIDTYYGVICTAPQFKRR